MKRIVFSLLIGISIMYVGCENTATEVDIEDPNTNECTPQFPEMDVTYDNFVKGVMDQYCISCHFTGNSPGPGDFTNYNGVKAASGFFAARVISDNADMPQGNAPLSQSIRDSLNIWIGNCSPRN
ncbi:hypothetical protein ACUNWD_14525 [Sunxiuqinia sp. A32]|uniref:hypothetical protein n=1 Tax=Sunxiuqinia sp. A32 TaxID=3461496 RepID=UPI0040468860